MVSPGRACGPSGQDWRRSTSLSPWVFERTAHVVHGLGANGPAEHSSEGALDDAAVGAQGRTRGRPDS